MSRKWFVIWVTITGLLIFLLPWTIPAHAQEPTPENNADSVVCHEHQYYLYDSGKWYCLCETPVRCTERRGGRTDTLVKDLVYKSLDANPMQENVTVCQDCRPGYYQSQVVKLASIVWINTTPLPFPTYKPVAQIVQISGGGR